MTAIKGFSNTKHKGDQKYLTLTPITGEKTGLDTTPKYPFATQATPIMISSIDRVTSIIGVPAHGAIKDDLIRVTSGAAQAKEMSVVRVIDPNTLQVSLIPDELLVNDEVLPMRHISLTVDEEGNLITAQGPIRFVRDGFTVEGTEDTADASNNLAVPMGMFFYEDGVWQPVNEDTITPANNRPLPVKLTSVTGDINITANDLNVQLSHNAANPDSVQIGDGTEILSITAAGEATTFDAQAHLRLEAIRDRLPLTLGQKVSSASLAVVLSTEQQALIDQIEALLTSIDGKDFATQTTLEAIRVLTVSLDGKDYATETTLAAISALLTSLDGKDFATETTLAALAAEDFATETTLAAVLTALGTLNGTDFATETTLEASRVLLASLDGKDFATQTTLEAIRVLAVSLDGKDYATETTLAANGVAQAKEAKQDTIITELQSIRDNQLSRLTVVDANDVILRDTSQAGQEIADSGSNPTELVATLAADVKKIQVIEDIGQFMALYTGAGAGSFLCALPLGGGDVDVNIPAGTRVAIKHLEASTISAGKLAINYLG